VGPPVNAVGTENYLSKFNGSDTALVNSGIIEVAGNIGIGLDSPTAKLHIKGASYDQTSLRIDQSWTDEPVFTGGELPYGGGFLSLTDGVENSPTTNVFLSANLAYYSNNWIMGNLGVGTNSPSNKLTVQGNADFTGNVGIGSTNPDTKLTVATSGDSYGIKHTNQSVEVSTFLNSAGGWIGTVSNHDFNLFTSNSVARLTVKTNGNVGIGTTAPIEKLSVSDAVSIRKGVGNGSSRGSFRIGANSTTWADRWAGMESYNTGGDDQSDLRFYTAYGTRGERMRIGNTGLVSIGTTSLSYQLWVNGSAGKPGGGSWTAASDRRLKQDITPYSDGLEQLLSINPVKYRYNEKAGTDTKKEYIGVIAQELKEVAPYMVGTFELDSTEYYDVDNSAMMYMLINAVKELNEKLDGKDERLDEQQKLIEQLQKDLNKLKKKQR
jgi:hypothetical protein